MRLPSIAFVLVLAWIAPARGSDLPSGVSTAAVARAGAAHEVLVRALAFVGMSYRAGGESPEHGFDCSGLVAHVFREALGLKLPRTSREMSRMGDQVAGPDLKPGDLVFYNTLRRAFSHVGIYLGDHRFVHAPTTGGVVRIEDMRQSYWAKRFDGARRIVSEPVLPASAASIPGVPAQAAASPPAAPVTYYSTPNSF